ncbi:MAG TPA: MarR family transcriptional regulator [Pseudolysinimonas sp.]|nr:MarR family transcriptional regulator [Pseudolysinimonas sp.]
MNQRQTLAGDFHEALRPLIRQLISARTLSRGKAGVLWQLSRRGRATASELAAAERVSAQAITIAVRELEELKLVGRTPDDVDRRKIWVELTDAGRRRLEDELLAGRGWLDDAIVSKLSDDERATLASVLPILHKLMGEPIDD